MHHSPVEKSPSRYKESTWTKRLWSNLQMWSTTIIQLSVTREPASYLYYTPFCCQTRSSAIAEEPHDVSYQLKSCQLPRRLRGNWQDFNWHCSAVRQVLNKSKLWSRRVKVDRCVVNMCTQPWHIVMCRLIQFEHRLNKTSVCECSACN